MCIGNYMETENNLDHLIEDGKQDHIWEFKIIPSDGSELIQTPATGRVSKTRSGPRNIIKAKNFIRRDSSDHQSNINIFILLGLLIKASSQSALKKQNFIFINKIKNKFYKPFLDQK